ncbi:hypothetical protein EG240_03775 [Paenimyroides tangerinum]|uniref:Lipoprotein n=1 Tax=Paenimyroides tangerinum TaxID=2488728 RepID=A0A3P3W3H0_9FLAO|nr:hypothetical protein [Paenimyroides tangerinum]RRJ88928.1 hypothetical protein EG240_13050 [Paenimyroides tangerinum]RRJ92304.1 hypothetical protein EG240_03775 [Paenimyroides tangerinum]
MKLKNIIIKSFYILLISLIYGCAVCKDANMNLYKKNNSDFTPLIEFLSGNEEIRLFGSGITSDYFKSRYKKTIDGQIVKKSFDLFDTDNKGNKFIYKTYPEELYSAFLFGKFQNISEHTIVVYGTIADSYIQVQYPEKSRDTIKVINIEVCNNNFHGKMQITDKSAKSLYTTKFKLGTGYWKDYHFVEETNEYPIKVEGKVKNNFKFGEWKYYNKEGNIDSVRIYTLKDSVDVRFPHCIFNKTEPCY